VCGGGHLALIGQHGQKCLDVGHPHLTRVSHTTGLDGAPEDEKTNSIIVSFIDFETIVRIPHPLAHLVEQAAVRQGRGTGFHGKFISV
jgi:hypothetical protein